MRSIVAGSDLDSLGPNGDETDCGDGFVRTRTSDSIGVLVRRFRRICKNFHFDLEGPCWMVVLFECSSSRFCSLLAELSSLVKANGCLYITSRREKGCSLL